MSAASRVAMIIGDPQVHPLSLGLRERQKLERRRRIEDAARRVFAAKGYDGATTREIAEVAAVSIGTLFAYAADKQELLAMVYRDSLRDLTETTFAKRRVDRAVVDQLIGIFKPRYAFWGKDVALARHAARETIATSYTAGAPPAQQPESLLSVKLVDLVRANQDAGRLRRDDDAKLIARVILDIYLSENRAWLALERPVVASGIARLRAALAFALRAAIND